VIAKHIADLILWLVIGDGNSGILVIILPRDEALSQNGGPSTRENMTLYCVLGS